MSSILLGIWSSGGVWLVARAGSPVGCPTCSPPRQGGSNNRRGRLPNPAKITAFCPPVDFMFEVVVLTCRCVGRAGVSGMARFVASDVGEDDVLYLVHRPAKSESGGGVSGSLGVETVLTSRRCARRGKRTSVGAHWPRGDYAFLCRLPRLVAQPGIIAFRIGIKSLWPADWPSINAILATFDHGRLPNPGSSRRGFGTIECRTAAVSKI